MQVSKKNINNILGLSCFYHDSSACLVKNGEVVSAIQEERLSRKKYDSNFPKLAINHAVQDAGITFDEIDAVAFYEKPFLKFSRVLFDHLSAFPFSYKSFKDQIPSWLSHKLLLPVILQEELSFTKDVFYIDHHLSHAASAFLPSSFEKSALLVMDGVGEYATFSTGIGQGNTIKLDKSIHYPDSIGLLYTTFTAFLGFGSNGGEGKTMGLSAYGEPRFLQKIEKIAHVFPDGSFRLNPKYFDFRSHRKMWSHEFEKLFGRPRKCDEELTQVHFDLAASVQVFLETVIIKNARLLYQETGLKNICLSGGVALNCVTNHKILEETEFQNIFVQPAAGDAGGCLGAALYVDNVINKGERRPFKSPYLGPKYSDREIEIALRKHQLTYSVLSEDEVISKASELLISHKIIAWFQDRMEFGPRALGNRSILANPKGQQTRDYINKEIKCREMFRPFAPVVLEEQSAQFFNLKQSSPFMLLASSIKEELRLLIPAVDHADGSARVQTLDTDINPKLRNLIESFYKKSGIPLLLNTSLNGKDEPIVCSPEDAARFFKSSSIDVLVIGNFMVIKDEVKP